MAGPNYDQLQLVGVLQSLITRGGTEMLSELQSLRRREAWSPSVIVGTVETRDEWSKLLRAALACEGSALVPAVAAQLGTFEVHVAPNAAGVAAQPRMLVKRLVVSNPNAAALDIIVYTCPPGQGVGGTDITAKFFNRLIGSPTANRALPPAQAFFAGAGSTAATPPIACVSGYGQTIPAGGFAEIEDDDAFLYEMAPGYGIGVQAQTVNVPFRVAIEFALVPDGGY